MGAMGNIGLQLVTILLQLFVYILMLRFLLQLSRADFYNPVTQSVVKATNPLVAPLQGILRPLGRFDIATLAAAFIVVSLALVAIGALFGGMLPIGFIALTALGTMLDSIINIYFFALIAMIILSWVAPQANHPGAILVHQLVDPIMKPVRKVIPSIGMLDLSPIFVFIALNLIGSLVSQTLPTIGMLRSVFG
ncbi:YggT family protein [Cobetia sp. 14N.309.X.WAT.E.A4]|uniref:YggT family protein n=1 Tax=Cobetia sp. 14N.309.X.WAT.E.A4 TaxID=2998323 RepID=UPI0025B27AEA|nr:YggT family protein [Cobetia sp. 14N.309.X.WAT.E.A4]MDN2656183.1 YggT family protein [Cobetia sp. 14N.309.X.WAT.E.A4]